MNDNPLSVETSPADQELARINRQFRELHRLSLAAEHGSYSDLYRDYLSTGADLLDMDVGIVSRIEDDRYTVLAIHPGDGGIAAGDVFALGDTYCSRVMDTVGPVAAHDVNADASWCTHPAYRRFPLGAYLAAPIPVEGSIYGTLNFTRSAARQAPFTEADVELVDLMALSLGRVIERDLMEQERHQAAHRIHENAELFENAFRYAAIGKALVSTDGRWLRVNRAVSRMFGYEEEELLQIDFQTITHPDDLDADLALVQQMLEGTRDSYQMEKRYYHRDGHIVWVLLSVSLAHDENGDPKCFISQLQDITKQKRDRYELERKRQELELANRQLRELAMVDPLTRVLNRRAFTERLNAELKDGARTGLAVSVVLLDVDYFKRFNDEFGHPAGDQALQRVAQVLSDAGRARDVVARYGGEEFAVILPHTDEPGSRVVAERLRAAIAAVDDLERPITASFGCATAEPRRGDRSNPDVEELVRAADEALYAAKGAGRNCAVLARDLRASKPRDAAAG